MHQQMTATTTNQRSAHSMWVRNVPQQIQDCMRNKPAAKYPTAKISRCTPPPPHVCPKTPRVTRRQGSPRLEGNSFRCKQRAVHTFVCALLSFSAPKPPQGALSPAAIQPPDANNVREDGLTALLGPDVSDQEKKVQDCGVCCERRQPLSEGLIC